MRAGAGDRLPPPVSQRTGRGAGGEGERSSSPYLPRILLATLIATLMVISLPASPASAHPLGNFSVNQYSRLEVNPNYVTLFYVLDLAELPTVADRPLLDGDGDTVTTTVEREAYLAAKLAEIAPSLHLWFDGQELPLQLGKTSLALSEGQAGLETTRIEATFSAALPAGVVSSGELTYRNDFANDRLGWREIVAASGPNLRLDHAEILAADRTNALRAYPDDLLSSPLDERSLSFAFAIAPSAPASDGEVVASQPGPLGIGERLSDIVNRATLSQTSLALALLAAAGWGAVHALSPGHGKTVVGAYLVGSRGTPRHALFLGLTVTITHTAGVLALGLVILFASNTILPEQLYPWLSLISGMLVVAVGLTILRQRLLGMPAFGHNHEHPHHEHAHEHDHAHNHDHGHVHAHGGHSHSHLPPGAEGETITWRGLLALGISGGLLPCPSALLALLGAVAVGRAGLGVLVVIAFSLGLAATLTAVGLLFLYAGRLLERRAVAGPWTGLMRFAPAAAALAVTASGVAIVARAVAELRWIS